MNRLPIKRLGEMDAECSVPFTTKVRSKKVSIFLKLFLVVAMLLTSPARIHAARPLAVGTDGFKTRFNDRRSTLRDFPPPSAPINGGNRVRNR